ncbi:hypothetical protein VTL71DRAFT_4910 [Oculimacula yallundae]|uniref:Nephrocystin 3-like N-terminal domain-containing protein n=1 Tax=Oculimacula yallundae TaxID=86028 RepID=A0ABR4C4I5_9HELO
MAEALAIVGSVAAIVQLSEFAGKVIYTACDIYSSVSGHTVIDQSVEDTTIKLNSLLDNLDSQAGPKPQNSQDDGLCELIDLCRALGQKLLVILAKTKAKRPHSLRESLKASMNSVWKKKEMNELRNELDRCQNQLGIHLLAIFRSEMKDQLEEALSALSSQSLEITRLYQTLDNIEHDQKLAVDSLEFLRELFSPSSPELQRLNEDRILRSLAFDGMKDRYQNVATSTVDTFNWSLEDTKVPKSHPDLKISFRNWLVEGKGVFHISGKPGAGKSTFMKFIVENENTNYYLEEWAGDKTLIVANFFFWKPGNKLEKNMEGLIRSVLHTILEAVPDMIPSVFPEYWNPSRETPWQNGREFAIPYKTVLASFEKLIGSADAMEDHCFCFFIDGLDEFEDPDQQHSNLARQLQSWTENNHTSLKICVSSREENAFMNNFLPSQRLRLHLLTQDDIALHVKNFLGDHDNFLKLDPEDREDLVDSIVEKAEGVFLWVKLVLNVLWEDLDACSNIHKLLDTLNHCPEELDDLFLRILNSIRRKDQEEAWAIVALLLNQEGSQDVLSLFQISFVKDCLKDDEFATRSDDRPDNLSQIMTRKVDFALHLKAILKGLIDIDDSSYGANIRYDQGLFSDLTQPALCSLRGVLMVTHRSIFDFLDVNCPPRMRDFIDKLDITSITLQILAAHVKLVPWDSSLKEAISLPVTSILFTLQQPWSSRRLEQIEVLDCLLMDRQPGCCQINGFDWSKIVGISDYPQTDPLEPFSILALAFGLGCESYYNLICRRHESWLSDYRTRADLCVCLFENEMNEPNEEYVIAKIGLLQRIFVDEFVTPEVAGAMIGRRKAASIWECFVTNRVYWDYATNEYKKFVGMALEFLLRVNFNPQVVFERRLLTWSGQENISMPDWDVEVVFGVGPNSVGEAVPFDDLRFWEAAKLPCSLREVVDHADFENGEELLKLIDRNLAFYERADNTGILGEVSEDIVMMENDDDEDDEAVYANRRTSKKRRHSF